MLRQYSKVSGGIVFRLYSACIFSALALTACGGGSEEDTGSPDSSAIQDNSSVPKEVPQAAHSTKSYIVVFHPSVADPAAQAQALLQNLGGKINHVYTNSIKGFAVTLPDAIAPAFLRAMQSRGEVAYVEPDKAMSAFETQSNATWGLDRIDQTHAVLNGLYNYTFTGQGVNVYVIDTGIRSTHLDFGTRVKPGYSVIRDGFGTRDCNGHGTHVAGTIGGTTWGVAKRPFLIPVRVLDCLGSGTLTGVVAGLDWAIGDYQRNSSRRPAVINMSLGGGKSRSLDDTVAKAVNEKGITVVVAAGNSNADACNYSPAGAAPAITVGATTRSDARASYSNFGKCLDLFAPGTSITSAWYTTDRSSNTLSGTSMASPHVAGHAAQILQQYPSATPKDILNALTSGAMKNASVSNAGPGSPTLLLYTGN